MQAVLKQKQILVAQQPQLEHYFIYLKMPNAPEAMPFLPIRAFRDFDLYTAQDPLAKTFFSSGSTGQPPSKHHFSDRALASYARHSADAFKNFLANYGFAPTTPVVSFIPPPEQWPNSSLAAMVGMFKEAGFPIYYLSLESSSVADCLAFLANTLGSSIGRDLVLFGTTFHHLEWMKKFLDRSVLCDVLKQTRLGIIDTGGTKGRTEALTSQQMFSVFKNFYAMQNCVFLSEYGMCELASQAWSVGDWQEQVFRCAPSLIPFAVELWPTPRYLPHGQKGFLAFYDNQNEDSWPTILTEDIGFTKDFQTFRLLGRAPQATLKGCSLNLHKSISLSGFSELQPEKSRLLSAPLSETKQWSVSGSQEELLTQLNPDIWPEDLRLDLEHCLKFSRSDIPLCPTLAEKSLLIIASGNTPISWFYPTIIAAHSGARKVTVKVPRLRTDDPLFLRVREQIIELMAKTAPFLGSCELSLEEHLDLDFQDFQICLAFGTSETIDILREKMLLYPHIRFIGLGDVQNAVAVDINVTEPYKVALECVAWLGRGCLTPVAVFLRSSKRATATTDVLPVVLQAEEDLWVAVFCFQMEYFLSQRFSAEQPLHPLPTKFWHHTTSLNVDIWMKTQIALGFGEIAQYRQTFSLVVDARRTSNLPLKSVPYGLGGSGVVFLFAEHTLGAGALEDFPGSFYPTAPQIHHPHCGKTWEQWFEEK